MDAARTIKVFLVDDAPAIRIRIAEMLRDTPQITIVGEADSPSSAIDGILRTLPETVVLDVHLTAGKGIEVLRAVRASHPEIVFIILTNSSDAQFRKLYLGAAATHFRCLWNQTILGVWRR